MARERALSLRIVADAKQARRELAGLEGAAGKHGRGTEKALSGVKGALLDIGVAGVGLFAFNEWNEAEKVARQTEAVLKSTGNAANTTAKDVADLAGAISAKTGIDDEAIQAGQNWLLTFKNVRNEAGKGNDIFDRTTETMVDLSVAMGTDSRNAANLLGKALNDPIKGVSALSRAGVTFTADQKEQIKVLTETGDLLGAQKIILQEVESQVKGSAEAQATGYDKAKVAAGNLAETAGGVLAPALEGVAGIAQFGAEQFQSLDEWQQQMALGIAAGGYVWLRWGEQATEAVLNLTNSSREASEAVSSVNGTIAKGAAVAGAGIAAYTLTYQALERIAGTGPDVEKLVEDLTLLAKGGQGVDGVAESIGTNVDDLAGAFRRASMETDGAVDSLQYMRDTFDPLGMDMRDARDKVESFDEALAKMVDSGKADEAKVSFDALVQTLMDQGLTLTEIVPMLPKYYDAVEDAGKKVGETEGGITAMTGAIDESGEAATRNSEPFVIYAERVDRARQATVDFYREQFEQANASIGAEANLDQLTASLAEHGSTLDENTEAGRSNKQALIDFVTSAAAASVGTDDAASSMQGYTMRLAESMMQAGFTKDEVDWLIGSMNLTPTDINTKFTSNASEESDRVGGYISRIMGVPSVWYTDFIARGGVGNIQGILGFADGGRPPMRRPSIVGERGPELFVPDAPGTIVPNHKIGGMVGGNGGGTTVVINLDGREVARHIVGATNRTTRATGRSALVSTVTSFA